MMYSTRGRGLVPLQVESPSSGWPVGKKPGQSMDEVIPDMLIKQWCV